MEETFNKIMAWVKGNPMYAAGAGLLAVLLFFPKLLRATRRRRVRRAYRPVIKYSPRRRSRRVIRIAPRRKSYTKGGKAKKPWQIKGSLAARRHMARLRNLAKRRR